MLKKTEKAELVLTRESATIDWITTGLFLEPITIVYEWLRVSISNEIRLIQSWHWLWFRRDTIGRDLHANPDSNQRDKFARYKFTANRGRFSPDWPCWKIDAWPDSSVFDMLLFSDGVKVTWNVAGVSSGLRELEETVILDGIFDSNSLAKCTFIKNVEHVSNKFSPPALG